MKVINYGSNYDIYPNDIKTFDQLPKGTYKVMFNPQQGFSLTKVYNLENREEKYYGTHNSRIEKAIETYEELDRSMGILLSGSKGMGKSVFAAELSEALNQTYSIPTIVVDTPYPGIGSFINSIEQEVMVLFDEFEKNFHSSTSENSRGGKGESQESLLGLFDGSNYGKKLFVLAANDIDSISQYYLNRPGRFHYNFSFTSPSREDIKEYLEDNLEPQYTNIIPEIVEKTNIKSLSFDTLRALAFELNRGYSYEESIRDLNIEIDSRLPYKIYIESEKGNRSIFKTSIDPRDKHYKLQGWDIKGDHYVVVNNIYEILQKSKGRDEYSTSKGIKGFFEFEGDNDEREQIALIRLEREL